MRVVFIGAVEFSRSVLQKVFSINVEVVGVCTLKASRFNADHCDLGPLSASHNVPWMYVDDINAESSLTWIKEKQPDVIFCFGWSKLLKEELLNLAPLGVIGFHPAALPANRGRHPLIWAIALGLEKTASSFFFMDSGIDSGDILSQKEIAIEPEDDAASLYEKMTKCAVEQICEFVPQLSSGQFARTPQDSNLSNNWRKRGREDGKIDWRMSAESIHNLVRSLAKPYVGAHFIFSENEFKIWETTVIRDVPRNIEPGKIIGYSCKKPIVKCGTHAICILKTDPEFIPELGMYL